MDDAELPAALDLARRARQERAASRAPGEPPTIAVVADRPDDAVPAVLTGAGWRVAGLLLADVFDAVLWASRTAGVARTYVELPELLLDDGVDAVCLAAPGPASAPALSAVLRAGLHLLLPGPADLPSAAVREALAAAEESGAEHAVGYRTRWTAPAVTVGDLLAGGAGPVGQVTARGWPTGAAATAELLDVVTGWCGAVVAVCASPEDLPATRLPGGAVVRWALLTEQGTTVLVAHDGAAAPVLRLSCPRGRLEMTADGLRWDGDDPLPLRAPAPAEPDLPDLPDGPPAAAGLLAAARHLAVVAATGDVQEGAAAEVTGDVRAGASDERPAVATLRDLFVTARAREALRASALEGRWVETG